VLASDACSMDLLRFAYLCVQLIRSRQISPWGAAMRCGIESAFTNQALWLLQERISLLPKTAIKSPSNFINQRTEQYQGDSANNEDQVPSWSVRQKVNHHCGQRQGSCISGRSAHSSPWPENYAARAIWDRFSSVNPKSAICFRREFRASRPGFGDS